MICCMDFIEVKRLYIYFRFPISISLSGMNLWLGQYAHDKKPNTKEGKRFSWLKLEISGFWGPYQVIGDDHRAYTPYGVYISDLHASQREWIQAEEVIIKASRMRAAATTMSKIYEPIMTELISARQAALESQYSMMTLIQPIGVIWTIQTALRLGIRQIMAATASHSNEIKASKTDNDAWFVILEYVTWKIITMPGRKPTPTSEYTRLAPPFRPPLCATALYP